MSHNFAAVYLNAEEDAPPKFVCIVNQVSFVVHFKRPNIYLLVYST